MAPRDHYITDIELRIFLKLTTHWVQRYLLLKYKAGLRQADLLSLRLDQLTQEGIRLRTRKAGRDPLGL